MPNHRSDVAALFALCLGASASAIGALDADRAQAAAAQVSGTIVLTFKVATSLPNGTVITVYPLVSPTDTVYSDGTSVSGSATVSGGTASLTLTIPYTWRVSSTSDKVTISADVYGYGSTSTTSISNSTYFNSTIDLPANGATKTVAYSGTL